MKPYFEKFALCLFLPRDSLVYLQAINDGFIVVARIFHILQLFCCTRAWHLLNSCPMHFSRASCREALGSTQGKCHVHVWFMEPTGQGNVFAVCTGFYSKELSLLWALAVIPTPVSFILLESLLESLFFATEIFSWYFLFQTSESFPSHWFLMLVFPFQSVVGP